MRRLEKMDEEYYDVEYLRDQIIIEEERRMQMEAEWQEAEEYKEKLPAKIVIVTKTPEKHEISTNI